MEIRGLLQLKIKRKSLKEMLSWEMQHCKRGILIKLYKSHEPAHAPH